jgi:hypothetical protein
MQDLAACWAAAARSRATRSRQIGSAHADADRKAAPHGRGCWRDCKYRGRGYRGPVWLLAVFALASSAPAGQHRVTFDGEAFGPRRTLTCSWFTNFENSRFEQCRDVTGKLLQEGDGASLKCVRGLCERLDAEARKAAGWREPEPPWGTFTVKLVGRVSLNSHRKRYLGDATKTVLIEDLTSVSVAK